MNIFKYKKIEKYVVPILKGGGIGVLPTDTLYGIIGSALDEKAVERVYGVRKRRPDKPCIILISNAKDILNFGINVSAEQKKILKKYWPGKVSVVLDCGDSKFEYLSRGTQSLSFRVPKNKWLRKLLEKTGPLIAPSANPEGKPHSKTIGEARKYFESSVDFYIDLGNLESHPSTIIRIGKMGKIEILRGKLDE